MAVGKDIPHDLGQYVIEAAAGYGHGFWGLVARGATFKSTGRRQTKPGRVLDRAFGQWQALRTGERLVFQWPSEKGSIEAPSSAST